MIQNITYAMPDREALAAIPGKHAQPDPATISQLPKGGTTLSYMGHAEVTLALLDVDPAWAWEPVAFDDETGGPMIHKQGNRLVMWGWLAVAGHRRLCVGTCEERKGDPEKELIGDLLRNGAMRFGIGTKLWSKAEVTGAAEGSGQAGWDRPATRQRPTAAPVEPTPAMRLYDEVRAVAGTPKADALKALANESGRKLSANAFADDPTWAELVAAELASAA